MLSQHCWWISITAQTLIRAAAQRSLIYLRWFQGIKLAQEQPVQSGRWDQLLDVEKMILSLPPVGTVMRCSYSEHYVKERHWASPNSCVQNLRK